MTYEKIMFKSSLEDEWKTISIVLVLWVYHLSLMLRSNTSSVIPKPEIKAAI